MIAAGERLGPYEITSPLGAGGMGEVWQARDKRLEREVALKLLPSDLILDAERRARLEREAKVLGSLNHPNIATLHALEELLYESENPKLPTSFSPDGRWVAYRSNESGHNEIYVQPYPGPGRKWQVSTSGGSWPLWRSDGREIFYRAPNGGIEATPIDARGDTLSLGTPKTLFPLSTPESTDMRYSPVADDGRFLLIEPVAAQVSRPLTGVLDWTARLAG